MTATSFELNYCHRDSLNITSRKAFDGKVTDVDALLAAGATIDDAIYGFAFGGHVDNVRALLAVHPTRREAAARGYARAKNLVETERFLASDELKRGIIFGYAQAGNEVQVRAALNSTGGSKFLPDVLRGLASTGQSALLLELVDGSKYYPLALKAAAKAGHTALVEQLLENLSINLDTLKRSSPPIAKEISPYLKAVLEGYSEGRHFEEAILLMELGVPPMSCLSTLSPKGTIDPTDANLLVSLAKKAEIAVKLTTKIKEQYGLDVGKVTTSTHATLLASLTESTAGSVSPRV